MRTTSFSCFAFFSATLALGGVASALGGCGGEIASDTPPPGASSTAPSPTAGPTATPPSTPTGSPSAPPPAPLPAPGPSPTACPTKAMSLAGASGVTSSVALGNMTFHLEMQRAAPPNVLAGLWSGASHAVAQRAAADRSANRVETLSADTWATTDQVTDAEKRTVVAYRGLTRLGSFGVRNTNLERSTFREGMSPDGRTVVFGYGTQTFRAPVTAGDDWDKSATPILCGGGGGCELLDAKAGEVLVSYQVEPGLVMLERRAYANLDTSLVAVRDPSNGRPVAAITEHRIFFDSPYDDLAPIVLDRATLVPVPFAWEAYEDIRAVRERADGTFDVFSVYSGEIASAKHVAADGTLLASGDGHAAYGQVSAGACGFWVDGRLLPYAEGRK